jgi:hypothetical protein
MSLVVMVFEILPALALGFVVGRIWQVRRDELDRRRFKVSPVARIPRLQSLTQREVGVRSTLPRAEHASMWGEYRMNDHAGRPGRPDRCAASFRVAAR